jgi:hypothetical protein
VPDIDAIKARLAAATPGPWARHGSNVWPENSTGPLFIGRDGTSEVRPQADADAEFVAHAKDDVAALVKLLEADHDEAKA